MVIVNTVQFTLDEDALMTLLHHFRIRSPISMHSCSLYIYLGAKLHNENHFSLYKVDETVDVWYVIELYQSSVSFFMFTWIY